MVYSMNNVYKAIIVVTIAIVFYNEYLVYIINSYKWPVLTCKHEETCVKLLLVSDPQLLGDNTSNYIIVPLAIWDTDRYLAKTYSAAVKHTNPDVVIFLGDLFDEGEVASRTQYHQYVKRLLNIFDTSYPIQHIWLPGDNDIGGENDKISKEKFKLFNDTFLQPYYINIKHLTFTKINRMMCEFTSKPGVNYKTTTSILLSHMPLAYIPSIFIEKVFDVFHPKLIFAGHEHKSMVVETNKYQDYRNITKINAQDNEIHSFILNEVIKEIIVPSCSYRMAKDEIGYGSAVIDKSGEVSYAVLWSPPRFYYLYIYVFTFISICIVFLYRFIKHRRKDNTVPKYGYTYYRYRPIRNEV